MPVHLIEIHLRKVNLRKAGIQTHIYVGYLRERRDLPT
jgi:hypothetical protein